MGKLKVVLSGIYYPVAILRYFQSALLRRDDVELLTVGPYTGNAIPWDGGMFVNCPLPKPDVSLSMDANGKMSTKSIEGILPWQPDLWIQVDAAFYLRDHPKCKQVFIGTDPHCVNYDYQRTISDVFFNMQTPYMKPGDHWLPYAYDPMYHHRMDEVEKTYDFGIIGANKSQGPLYENRDRLVKALRDRGYAVYQAFGKSYFDYTFALNHCKVGLNWSTREDTVARVFETMACGVALLTNHTPDLEQIGFIPDDSYVSFTSLDSATMNANVLMGDDILVNGLEKKWERIARTGHSVVKTHTYDARVQQVLDESLSGS